MKTSYKFILLILIACLCSIFIYYKIEKVIPVENVEHILITQEKIENDIFDENIYTFENPKVILNPYKISPLTALIIFETNDLTTPTITIKGKDEKTTYSKTFIPGKTHILPIYGLYADYNNEIILKINNKEKIINIQTERLPNDFTIPTKIVNNKEKLNNDLYFVTPAAIGYTAAYDINGDVRWYLTEKFNWDIQRLSNGNIMLSNNRLINPPYYTTGLIEMDLLGKIYYEYSIPGGYHHDVFEMENGNLLVASNDFENGTVEDYIVEIDRKTGDIIKEFDLKDILPIEQGRNILSTDYDWFHNNSIWYDKNTNSITLSGRHQDAVINIDYDTKELNWIVGDKANWDTDMQKYFFTPIGDLEWQWAQHAAMILPNNNLFLFDNGNNRSKTEEGSIKAINNYSRGVMYNINTIDMTITQEWEYGKQKGSEFYSPYISDVDYLDENHYLIHSGGISYKDGQVQNQPAGLIKADKLNSITIELLNDEIIFEMHLPNNYYRSEKMSLYSNNNFNLGQGMILGNLDKTSTIKNDSMLLFNKKIDNKYEEHDIEISKEIDRLVVSGTFKKGDDIKIILDNVFDKKTYDLKVSKKPYTAMCIDIFNEEELENGIRVTKYINDIDLNGKYYIYIEINNKIYDTNQYIIF